MINCHNYVAIGLLGLLVCSCCVLYPPYSASETNEEWNCCYMQRVGGEKEENVGKPQET